MLRYVPGASVAGLTTKLCAKISVVSPNANPARKARMLASATSGFLPNFSLIHSSLPATGRENIHDSRPSANMFFERSMSFCVSPVMPSSAPSVSLFSGILKTS